jgi:hypothetical protein
VVGTERIVLWRGQTDTRDVGRRRQGWALKELSNRHKHLGLERNTAGGPDGENIDGDDDGSGSQLSSRLILKKE